MDIQDSDAGYYRMRERHERNLADQATVEEARIIHQTLADKYRSLATKAEREQLGSVESISTDGQLAIPCI